MTKTLIITAGDKSGGKFLTEVWLPTLRGNAEYRGDVLILDYDLLEEYRSILRRDSNVFIEKIRMVKGNVWEDRHRDIYALLTGSYSAYETILCIDGNDVTFQKPITPLFEQAKDIVCYVTETGNNSKWIRIKSLEDPIRVEDLYGAVSIPDGNKMWEAMKDKPMINGGLYVGPISDIVKLEQFVYECCKYSPVDQLWLNALVYYHGFRAKRVDDTWNWARTRGTKVVDGIYYTPGGERIAIYHDH